MLLSFVSASSFSIILITFSSCNLQNILAVVNIFCYFHTRRSGPDMVGRRFHNNI